MEQMAAVSIPWLLHLLWIGEVSLPADGEISFLVKGLRKRELA